jgi:DNA modification methylase
MTKKTKTSSFGVAKREGHDSSSFYRRNIYGALNAGLSSGSDNNQPFAPRLPILDDWRDRLYELSSETMPIPDNSVALSFTSPPYNVGKQYDDDMTLEDYLRLIKNVGKEVYRVLVPGGRYVVNIANLGRKPYLPINSFFYQIHDEIGFLPMGEIIWQKAAGANGSCAWGSYMSAKAPRIRDIHEYLLVFSKGDYSRAEKGESDISSEEFMESTLSIWKIPPESASRIGHPAPFPIELAARVIKLFSYVNDVVLDPFMGSGTTCLAAKKLRRHYVGFEIESEYIKLAEKRLLNQEP